MLVSARVLGGVAAVAIVAAVVSAAWTAYQAAPSGRAKDSAEPQGPTTRLVFLVAPYLVLGVLVLLLALAGRTTIVSAAGEPDVVRALSYGVIAGAVVQLVFAVSELRRRRSPGVNLRAWSLVGLAIVGSGSQAWFLSRLGTDSVAFTLGHVTVAAILLAVAAVVGLGWMSDPNMLSMHSFYKARLVRAYLGASNPDRRGERVTDAVPGDDVPLRDLCNHDRGAPYHLVNTTLNLVASVDLATAQRSAANFVLSSYYCGSARTGYRLTAEYMGGELTLGTAVAISGAAASPNMGSRTPSMPLVMLLALVNARLGFWAPTPFGARWREPLAALWPFYLLREALSQTTDLSTYCYLTDGGHFDNGRPRLRGDRARRPGWRLWSAAFLQSRSRRRHTATGRRRDLSRRPALSRPRERDRPGDPAGGRRAHPLSTGALGPARPRLRGRHGPHRRDRLGEADGDDG